MTRERVNAAGEGMIFADVDEVHRAYHAAVDLHARVRCVIDMEPGRRGRRRSPEPRLVDTTVGRALLLRDPAEGLPFAQVNRDMDQEGHLRVDQRLLPNVGLKETVVFADQLMYTGLPLLDPSGISIGVERHGGAGGRRTKILGRAEAEVKEIQDQYASGLVTDGERYNKVVDIWSRANDQVAAP